MRKNEWPPYYSIRLKTNGGTRERRLMCRQTRCVDDTPSAKASTDKLARASASAKVQPSDSCIPDCSNTAHNVNKTIIVINFSFQMTCSILFIHLDDSQTLQHTPRLLPQPQTLQVQHKHLEPNSTLTQFHQSPIPPSAELDTPSVNTAATLPSLQDLDITDLAQDVANELLHGGFTFLFIECSLIIAPKV